MTVTNPFAGSDPEGSIWEQGFLAGFQQPDVDSQPPFHPNLLEVYQQGVQAGRDTRQHIPPEKEGTIWANLKEILEVLADQGLDQLVDWTVEKVLEPVAGTFAGMVTLLVKVVQIPGDVQLEPLPDNFNSVIGRNDADDNPRYVSMCFRTDHVQASPGVTDQGTWTGEARTEFGDAIADMNQHGHAETFVVRCSLRDNTCGVVWAAKPN